MFASKKKPKNPKKQKAFYPVFFINFQNFCYLQANLSSPQ